MSELLIPSRRGFLSLLGAALAAPAIIRLAPIMPVRPIPLVIASEADLAALPSVAAMLDAQKTMTDRQTDGWMTTNGKYSIPWKVFNKNTPDLIQKLDALAAKTKAKWGLTHNPGKDYVRADLEWFNADGSIKDALWS